MNTVRAWFYFIVFYPYNRFLGYTHVQLRTLRHISAKVG